MLYEWADTNVDSVTTPGVNQVAKGPGKVAVFAQAHEVRVCRHILIEQEQLIAVGPVID